LVYNVIYYAYYSSTKTVYWFTVVRLTLVTC
jgi:hypothetical protein